MERSVVGDMKAYDRYIQIIDSINNAPNHRVHDRNYTFRQGFFEGLKACGWSDASIGSLIMDGDRYQMNKGIDRPMMGGVFLDWTEPNSVNDSTDKGSLA